MKLCLLRLGRAIGPGLLALGLLAPLPATAQTEGHRPDLRGLQGIADSNVAIRTAPSAGAGTAGTLAQGSRVQVLDIRIDGDLNEWWRIADQDGNELGFVPARLMTETRDGGGQAAQVQDQWNDPWPDDGWAEDDWSDDDWAGGFQDYEPSGYTADDALAMLDSLQRGLDDLVGQGAASHGDVAFAQDQLRMAQDALRQSGGGAGGFGGFDDSVFPGQDTFADQDFFPDQDWALHQGPAEDFSTPAMRDPASMTGNPGRSAQHCLGLSWEAAEYTEGMQHVVFSNSCDFPIFVIWCVETSDYADCRQNVANYYASSGNIDPGGTLRGGRQLRPGRVDYGACEGTIGFGFTGFEDYDNGDFTCLPTGDFARAAGQ